MRHGRHRERGYVMISAIVLSVLYFALMALMLIETTHALREAQRFRARVMVSTLAENAVELAAADLVNRSGATVDAEDWQGKMTAEMRRADPGFEITAKGVTTGVSPQTADVRVQGRVKDKHVTVDYTYHSQ